MATPVNEVKAEFFKSLGHPARIRILEILRNGERTVSGLIPDVEIEGSHLSQQLRIMRRANLVESRKVGSTVLYSVNNPALFELLDIARRIITTSLAESQDILSELEAERQTESKPATVLK